MSKQPDHTAKTIRALALASAAMGEASCGYELADGTRITVHAAETPHDSQWLIADSQALPPVAARCIAPMAFLRTLYPHN